MSIRRNPLVMATLAAYLLGSRAWAADNDVPAPESVSDSATDDGSSQEVIVTGTHQKGIRALDSPAPIQVVSNEELTTASSTPDLIQTLASALPSLDTSNFGGDLSNLTLQAALRYLNPNDTLILINGKRRHTTSNISIGGVYEFSGGAGADLNFIPVEAIDHIEVLTDGAAAQYGSDAIAGVINIILKKDAAGGNLQATHGGYQDGGGSTSDYTGNVGFEPYDGAYFSLSGEIRNHGHTVRSEALDYILNPSSTSGLYPAAGLKPIDSNVLNVSGWPILNRIAGDAAYRIQLVSFNSGFRLGEGVELYSFGTYGQKTANSYENYRLPHVAAYKDPTTGETEYQYPYGFTPLEAIDETDYGITGGLRGGVAGWSWDLSSTYGRDNNDFYTLNSSNTVEYSETGYSPTDFYDGLFKATQWTNTLDLDRELDVGLAGPVNLALGGEFRRDAYVIGAGTPLSYELGGAASFQGFSPTDAGGHSRTNSAGYLDLAGAVAAGLRVDFAGRFEHYSDFGDAKSGKLTLRYDFSPAFAVRGTVSNGFRAPTVAEEYYTKSATSPTSTGVTLAPDAPAAALLGLGALRPETSVNYSLGVVFNLTSQFSGTLDLYHINLDHRIISSATLYAELNGVPVSSLVSEAITVNGNQLNQSITTQYVSLFVNGVDTATQGADLTLNYLTDFGSFGKVDWSLKTNFTKTQITGQRSTPQQLSSQGLTLLSPTSFAGITDSLPKYNINVGGRWTFQKLSLSLREIVHGSTTPVTGDSGATTQGKITYYTSHSGVIPLTNIDVGYEALKSLTLTLGAANVFNRYPDRLNSSLLSAYQSYGLSSAANPYTNSPIGIDGGYYYLKATYEF